MGSVIIVPYTKNLLKTVVDNVICDFKFNFHNINIIFTHRRSIHFYYYYLSKKASSPFFVGNCFAIEDFVHSIYYDLGGKETIIDEYDQAYIAYQAAMNILPEKYHKSLGEFFPWAFELVSISRELDLELIDAKDILYPPEELNYTSKEILQRLGKIYDNFNMLLKDNNFITQWKITKLLSSMDFKVEGKYFFIGFFALTRAEEGLLKKFYHQGATFYWHADPENLPDIYKRWIKNWNINEADIKVIDGEELKREVFFIESYDLHSELDELKKRVSLEESKTNSADKIAVVLPDPSTLIPTLYNLPREFKINVTMGYPFTLSSIFVLIDTLLRLVLKKDDKLGFPTKELLKLLKNPYLRENEYFSLLTFMLEDYQAPYIKYEELKDLADRYLPLLLDRGVETERFKKEIMLLFKEVIDPVLSSSTTEDFAKAIISLTQYIKAEISAEEDSFFMLERTFIHYLLDRCVPILKRALFSTHPMEIREIASLFLKICSTLRIPLEGEPLCGLQVMGMLETRDLSFDCVYILDVNEGVLPKVSLPSPLFPQHIREILQFPTQIREQAIFEYHFERLLKTCKRIFLFYQNRSSSSRELEDKRIRSRYIEKVIWEVEKRNNKLINEDLTTVEDNLTTYSFLKSKIHISLPEKREEVLEKTEELGKSILQEIKKITPSLLNSYLFCPRRFLFSNILKLTPKKRPEEIRYDEMGKVIHKSLEEFFKPVCGLEIDRTYLKYEVLEDIFLKNLKQSEFFINLSESKKFLFVETAKFRLRQFLDQFPEKTKVIYLEKEISTDFESNGEKFKLTGRIDRIDLRNNGIYYILDYKSGRVPECGNILKDFEIPISFDREGLISLYTFLKDIQLPFYVYLYAVEKNIAFSDVVAGFVDLAYKGEEIIWINEKKIQKQKEDYQNFFSYLFPEILNYLIGHMLYGPVIGPIEPKTCTYCDYKFCCHIAF